MRRTIRSALFILVVLAAGCDEDDPAYYADGTLWKPVMPVSPGAVLPRDMNQRQWSEFLSSSGIQGDRSIKSFAPTWLGFSADPAGDINYYDFGAFVVLWRDTALVGTSDEAFMVFSGLPASITPTSARTVKCLVEIGTDVVDATLTVNENGGGAFGASDTTTVVGRVVYSANFPTSGSKGIPAGFLAVYTK